MADCEALWSYRVATIRWNLQRIAEGTDDQVDVWVQHELTHVLLAGITGVGRKVLRLREEEITTLVQRTIEYAAYAAPPDRAEGIQSTGEYLAGLDAAAAPSEGA